MSVQITLLPRIHEKFCNFGRHVKKPTLKPKKRGGFVTGPLVIGITLMMLGVMVVISQVVVELAGESGSRLLTKMPTFYKYDSDGNIVTSMTVSENDIISLAVPLKTKNVEIYEGFFFLSLIGTFGIIILASFLWFAEDFDLIPPGTASKMAIKSVLLTPLFFILPIAWDALALSIQALSLHIMNPFEPENPSGLLSIMFKEIGSVFPPGAFDPLQWNAAVLDPNKFVQGLLKDVVLALFKGITAVQLVGAMMWFASMRIIFTITLVTMLPVIWQLKQIPEVDFVGKWLFRSLVGLVISPLISSAFISIGYAHMADNYYPGMEEWFMYIGIIFVAIATPMALSPITGFVAIFGGQFMMSSINTLANVLGSIIGNLTGSGIGGKAANKFMSGTMGASIPTSSSPHGTTAPTDNSGDQTYRAHDVGSSKYHNPYQ